MVIIFLTVTVNGHKNCLLMQKSYANKIYSCQMGKMTRSAIQITAASSICWVLDMLASGCAATERLHPPGRTSHLTPYSPTASLTITPSWA